MSPILRNPTHRGDVSCRWAAHGRRDGPQRIPPEWQIDAPPPGREGRIANVGQRQVESAAMIGRHRIALCSWAEGAWDGGASALANQQGLPSIRFLARVD